MHCVTHECTAHMRMRGTTYECIVSHMNAWCHTAMHHVACINKSSRPEKRKKKKEKERERERERKREKERERDKEKERQRQRET